MEISEVRRRLQHGVRQALDRAAARRETTARAEQAYTSFLQGLAEPLVHQLASALKAEGIACTVSTPAGGVRLALDRGREDYVDIALDSGEDEPHVVIRSSATRGSRTLTEERILAPGERSGEVTEGQVLESLVTAVAPWLAR